MRSALIWTWRVTALSGALLWGACSKESAPEPASKPQPAKVEATEEPATAPESEAAEPSGEPQAAHAEDEGPPPEFKVGQTREEVMSLFGDCAERKVFVPPGPGALYVEVYQAKDIEVCRKRLGERQFTIRGGTLYQITPGLIPPDPPRKEPSDDV